METLQYGLKKPTNNDRGPAVFPALEDNFEQLDSHDHNGITSKKLPSNSVEAVTSNVLAAGWTDLTNGHYKQTVTMPANTEFSKVGLEVRLSTGEVVHPSIVKLSETQYEIYFDDNTKDLKVLYV